MIKSDMLMKLETHGLFYHGSDGGWYNGYRDDVDLTPYLLKCGLFEH